MKITYVTLMILASGLFFLIKEIHEDTIDGYHKEYRAIEMQYKKEQSNFNHVSR